MPSNRRFMEVWAKAQSLSEAATELGMTRRAATLQAARLRHYGWNLKYFGNSSKTKTRSAKMFAKVWNDSKTAQEAAERLGVCRQAATGRARRLRKKGFQLKRMPLGMAVITKEQMDAIQAARPRPILTSERAKAMRARVKNLYRASPEEGRKYRELGLEMKGVLRALGLCDRLT